MCAASPSAVVAHGTLQEGIGSLEDEMFPVFFFFFNQLSLNQAKPVGDQSAPVYLRSSFTVRELCVSVGLLYPFPPRITVGL